VLDGDREKELELMRNKVVPELVYLFLNVAFETNEYQLWYLPFLSTLPTLTHKCLLL
jgi:hypothetical protein